MTTDAAPRERDPFVEAVGLVTIAGAQLDFSLRNMLGSITREPTLIMYANAASTSQLIELCRLALKTGVTADKFIPAIEDCLTRADRFRVRRNTIVHALYLPTGPDGGVEAMNPLKKKMGYNSSPVTVEEMESLVADATILRSDMFSATWNASTAGLPGMPPIPPRRSGEAVDGVPT
jgi:hypothetical protein